MSLADLLKKYIPTAEQVVHAGLSFIAGAVIDFLLAWATDSNIIACVDSPAECITKLKGELVRVAAISTLAYIKSFPRKQWTPEQRAVENPPAPPEPPKG